MTLQDQIDQLLPQTQCTRCGFSGCRPYAKALTEGVELNRCPPGGAALIEQLSLLLGRPPLPLSPAHGIEAPRLVAQIVEQDCIGCTKCLPVCPVDAIIGAAKKMHTVVAELCTGCELCIAPCPVDCIVLVAPPSTLQGWSTAQAASAKVHYLRHQQLEARGHSQRGKHSQTIEQQDTREVATSLAKLALAAALKSAST